MECGRLEEQVVVVIATVKNIMKELNTVMEIMKAASIAMAII